VIARQATRFAIIGVLNTGSYYLCYLTLHLATPYLVAHVLAMVISITVSFFLNCRFTYHTRPTWRKFLLFPLTNAVTYIVVTAGMIILVGVLGVDEVLAPLVAACVAIPATFLISRLILLGRWMDRQPVGLPAPSVSADNV